jgi:hypothetical protein
LFDADTEEDLRQIEALGAPIMNQAIEALPRRKNFGHWNACAPTLGTTKRRRCAMPGLKKAKNGGKLSKKKTLLLRTKTLR